MLTKDDLERAIHLVSAKEADYHGANVAWTQYDGLVHKYRDDVLRVITTFFQSLAIDEDKAVEAMARGMVENSTGTRDPDKLIPMPRGTIGMQPLWKSYEHLAKAALHASPYYKLVKMMEEV